MIRRNHVILLRFLSALALVPIFSGCNAIYFYETEKISLTLEARPDASAPVSGNLGYKQRIAAVVPPNDATSSAKLGATTDAVSLLSSFYFNKDTGFSGAVTIETSLISGKAASSLQAGEATEAAKAMAVPALDETLDAASQAAIDAANKDAQVKAHLIALVRTDYANLTVNDKIFLGNLTNAGPLYADAQLGPKYHQNLQKALKKAYPNDFP
jgi:hypothetical protein